MCGGSEVKKLPVLEKHIQRAILEYLWATGIMAFKFNNVGIKKPDGSYIPSGCKGVSDILGILPGGRFLAIEVKRPGGKATQLQQQFIDNVNDKKGLAFIAYSVDDVAAVLGGKLT
jgi:hypothetical protein